MKFQLSANRVLLRVKKEEKQRVTQCRDSPHKVKFDEHMLTYIPFRSWCRFCVMGKSVAGPHRRVDKRNEGTPTVSIDYAFLNENQEIDTGETCECRF